MKPKSLSTREFNVESMVKFGVIIENFLIILSWRNIELFGI